MRAERRFRAMGSSAHLLATGAGDELLEQAEARLVQLEQRWSRFLPDSELCRLNAADGRPVRVSTDTAQLLRRAVEAWRLTEGLFDPTVLSALEAVGYDRSFEKLRAEGDALRRTSAPSPGCAGITIDSDTGDDVVQLPRGVRLDLGGIGKGYAADQVAYELRQRGAAGACVNLGGDVRVSGPASTGTAGATSASTGPANAGTGWRVGVTDPFDPRRDLTTLTLDEGAVATSSRRQRRWRRGSRELHHLVDPRTGQPARTTLVAVTVVAAQAHWAEILAKAALIAGRHAGSRLLEAHGLCALLVVNTGEIVRVGSMEVFETWTRSSGGTSPVRAV